MIDEHIPDVSLEFMDGGLVRIEQSAGSGESYMVDLHPIHVSFIAERMGLLKTGPDLSHGTDAGRVQQIATLTRRVHWLADRISEIGDHLPHDMDERCADAHAFNQWWQMLCTATAELVACPDAIAEPAAAIVATDDRGGGPPLVELLATHLRRLKWEIELLMDHQIAPKDAAILVDLELYYALSGLQTLIESMCDSLPEEKRNQARFDGIAGSEIKASPATAPLAPASNKLSEATVAKQLAMHLTNHEEVMTCQQ